jgi:tetratricopeptide (TPR) repeat protein
MTNPEMQFKRGVRAYERGDLAAAAEAFAGVLRQVPDTPDVLYMLGVAQFKMGRSDEGIAHVARAVELAPTASEYANTLGVFLDNVGRTQEAIGWYGKALALDPNKVLTLHNLGFALRRLGQYQPALAAYQRAAKLQVNNHVAIKGVGDVMNDAGKPDEALKFFEAALRIKQDYVDGLISLGNLQLETGRIEEAEATFRSAITIDPACMPAHYSLSDCRQTAAGDPRFELLESYKEKSELPQSDLAKLHFALGKMYDSAGDPAHAFANFQRGNELRAQVKGRRYSFDRDEARCAVLTTVCTREYFTERSDYGVAAEEPVFVVGMPRSGTTLIEQIIASHPEGFGGGELPFMNALVRRSVTPATGGEAQERSAAEADDPGAVEATLTRAALEGLTRDQVASSAAQYLAAARKLASRSRRIVDKLPHNFWNLWLIELMFPQARIVHCRRHALDICLSCYFTDFEQAHGYKSDLTTLGRYYRLYEQLMAHWDRTLHASILTVDYEQLVERPEEGIRAIIAHCDLPWDESCLRFYEGRRSVRTASSVQVRRRIYSSSVARWKRYESFLGPLIDALGDRPHK